MAAIVNVESGGNSLAIGDNTAGRSYYPRDRATAEALARRLLQAGHSIDVGIAQIDSMNFPGFGVTVHSIFDPCINLSIGATILADDYSFAARRYRDAQVALRHAIGMYNTGRVDAGARYVSHVLAAAGIQDGHASGPRIVTQREAMRDPLLVHVVIAQRRSSITGRSAISPSRAPILVTVARTPRVKIL
jgi:hypothetical protein